MKHFGDSPKLMLVLKKMGDKMRAPEPMMDDYEDDEPGFDFHNEGKHAAAQEMMEAVRDSNVDAFTSALESFIRMCKR